MTVRDEGTAFVPATSADPEKARRAFDQLYSAAYDELRRIAATVRRGDPSDTCTPTALVNAAWLKLAGSHVAASASLQDLKRIAASAIRQVLVDAARARNADKRGGRGAVFVTFDDAVAHATLGSAMATSDDLVALDVALTALARLNARQAQLVEYRFFLELEVADAAVLLGVSEATALRDWRAAKAWLAREVRGARLARAGAPSAVR